MFPIMMIINKINRKSKVLIGNGGNKYTPPLPYPFSLKKMLEKFWALKAK